MKTKLMADLKSIERLDEYQADGIIINDPEYSCYNDRFLSETEIHYVIEHCRKKGLISIINLDRIIEQEELSNFYQTIEQYLAWGFDFFIVGDFAAVAFFSKHQMTDRLIYNPQTLITNRFDAQIMKGLESLVMISGELTLEEIKPITEAGNTVMEVYGYHQMSYSRRNLLSSFSEFQGKNLELTGQRLGLKEELRDDLYSIFQSEHGTFVYTSYRYCLFTELKNLPELRFAKISGQFVPETELISVIGLYRELLDGNYRSFFEMQTRLKAINPNLGTGYLHQTKDSAEEKDHD
jgi:putative protease